MSNKSEQLTREHVIMKDSVTDPNISFVEANEQLSTDEIQKMPVAEERESPTVVDGPLPPATKADMKKAPRKKPQPTTFNKRGAVQARMLREHCRHLCLSLFYREHAPIRSLGVTSSIAGEGKSFVAAVMAQVLANDSSEPVTLLECNWDHPSQHAYFGIPATPGLAEWLRGTCDEADIRYQVQSNLTVIPAGTGVDDAVKLLKQVQQQGLLHTLTQADGFYIVDLPPILSSGYGSLAASLLESLVLVVRAQVIPESMVAETCTQLKELSIHGIILNQGDSRIPRWLRQLL
jgi:Mrp family chromosome partitioning ATPase